MYVFKCNVFSDSHIPDIENVNVLRFFFLTHSHDMRALTQISLLVNFIWNWAVFALAMRVLLDLPQLGPLYSCFLLIPSELLFPCKCGIALLCVGLSQ